MTSTAMMLHCIMFCPQLTDVLKSEADNLVYVHQQKPTVSKIQAAYSKEEREIVLAGHNS